MSVNTQGSSRLDVADIAVRLHWDCSQFDALHDVNALQLSSHASLVVAVLYGAELIMQYLYVLAWVCCIIFMQMS